MRLGNTDSTSLLTQIVPGLISLFIISIPGLFRSGALESLSSFLLAISQPINSPSQLVVLTAISIIVGKLVNFFRIKISYVPSYFRRVVYIETENPSSLSFTQRCFDKVEDLILHLSSLIYKFTASMFKIYVLNPAV